MLNPFTSNNSGSYMGLKHRVFGKLKSSKLDEQISALIQGRYEEVLKSEKIMLSKLERKRLMVDVSVQLLNDLLRQMKADL